MQVNRQHSTMFQCKPQVKHENAGTKPQMFSRTTGTACETISCRSDEKQTNTVKLRQGRTTFAIAKRTNFLLMPAVSRLFWWITAASEFRIFLFFALLLFRSDVCLAVFLQSIRIQ